MRIDACFDSHVHWLATGEFAERLRLESLTNQKEILNLKIPERALRGEWILGFGWDQSAWPEQPTREILDLWQPNRPVALTRADGHALWVNSECLRRVGLLNSTDNSPAGGRIERDAQGQLTGILVDQAMELVQKHIPKPAALEQRRNLLSAMKVFNKAGYTHIRDMTCDETQWSEALKLDESGVLTLAVEEYFWLKTEADLDKTILAFRHARASQGANLRALGIKVFLDGALGSDGAWLSTCYHGKAHSGLKLWEDLGLSEVLIKSWEVGAEVAVHAIGDEAAQKIIVLADQLKSKGKTGKLHLEHGELIRPETIELMRGLQVQCHMQPAHWLSDQRWLGSKVGALIEHAFPWRRLQEAEIPFDFGSDSPIEPASIARIYQALRLSSEAGIGRLLGLPSSHMGHRDLAWAPNSFTLLAEENPVQVVFRGEHLL